jgi:hypothetical protein
MPSVNTVSVGSAVAPNHNSIVKAQVCNVAKSSQRTVKMFNTFFHGTSGKVKGFAIGDSAAEITLVKKELTDSLGIYGERCSLDLLWTDSALKRTEAFKLSLKISSTVAGDDVYELDECYAVTDLILPARSLNVERLKNQFSYLKDVPFSSYTNAVPSLLIGTRHATLMEAIEPVIQGGMNKPIALKTKLGYTIYGGAPECFPGAYTVYSHGLNTVKYCDDDNKISNNPQIFHAAPEKTPEKSKSKIVSVVHVKPAGGTQNIGQSNTFSTGVFKKYSIKKPGNDILQPASSNTIKSPCLFKQPKRPFIRRWKPGLSATSTINTDRQGLHKAQIAKQIPGTSKFSSEYKGPAQDTKSFERSSKNKKESAPAGGFTTHIGRSHISLERRHNRPTSTGLQ